MTRDALTILVGISSIIAVILTFYNILSEKVGAKKAEMTAIKDRLADHEIRIKGAERVTETVENFMEELLVDSLRSTRKRRQ